MGQERMYLIEVVDLVSFYSTLRALPQEDASVVDKKEVKVEAVQTKEIVAEAKPVEKVVEKVAEKTEEKPEEDEDDIDLFGDDDDEEAEKIREEMIEQRAQEQLAKNALKDKPVAKSSILFDIKPWDSETDLPALEVKIRQIAMDGLVWGASELKPVAFGINKLTIMCTVVDDLVSSDILQEQIEAFEDEVQSVDIAAFTKI